MPLESCGDPGVRKSAQNLTLRHPDRFQQRRRLT
jgi:hypothetical protein